MREITEGLIQLRKCGGCRQWFKDTDLCGNEETHVSECIQCYIKWQTERLGINE